MNFGLYNSFDTPAPRIVDGQAKAWVICNSSGSILSSFNVSSVVQNGTGDISITWYSQFQDSNYVVITNSMWASGTIMACTIIRAKTSKDVQIQSYRLSGGVVSLTDPDQYMIAVYSH